MEKQTIRMWNLNSLKPWSDPMIGRMKKRGFVTWSAVLFAVVFLAGSRVVADEDTLSDSRLSFSGFLEMENQVNVHTDQEFHDAVKKNELHGKFRIRWGEENAHVWITPDIRLSSALFTSDDDTCAYADRFDVARNGRISNRGYDISVNEAYLHLGDSNARLRIGNQIYGWGTADVFNPTAYFNPYDMRETFFKDEDGMRLGVPSVSGMVFLDNLTVEAVWVPFHIPGILAGDGRHWSIHMDNYQLPIVFDEVRALDRGMENNGFGVRFSSTVLGTDLSVSLYHGPDKDLLYRPTEILVEPGEPLAVRVVPETHPVSYLGLDMSKSLDKLVIQAELAVSPDKRAIMTQAPGDPTAIRFPYAVKRSAYIACALGFNYFIPLHQWIEDHEGDTVLTMEWYTATFIEEDRADPVISDLVSARFEDTYARGRVPVSLTCLVSLGRPGYAIWPKIGYDFRNGLSTSLSYIHLEGRSEAPNATQSLFYYFRNNDTLAWTIHYDF